MVDAHTAKPTAASAADQDYCMNTVADISKHVHVQFSNGPKGFQHPHTDYFWRFLNGTIYDAEVHRLIDTKQICPIFTVDEFNCYRQEDCDRNEYNVNYDEITIDTTSKRTAADYQCHARRAEQRQYQVIGCQMHRFNPVDFLELVSGRNILIGYDSIGRETFQYLVCSLFTPEMKIKYQLLSGNDVRVSFLDYNVTIHLFGRDELNMNLLKHWIDYGNLRPKDILYMNAGLRFDHPNQLTPFAHALLEGWNVLPDDERPFLLWRESWTQHFSTVGGIYERNTDLLRECRPITNMTEYHIRDWRNKLIDELLPNFRVWYKKN